MTEKRSWCEFKKIGLLWLINFILHLFGWAIVFEYNKETERLSDDMEPKAVYPARTKYRGFSERANSEGYQSVTEYLNENIGDLLKEARNE